MDHLKLLAVVTSTGRFARRNLKTGLWLSELTHIYHQAKEQGAEITIANPEGGFTPVDPVSLKPVFVDKISGKYWNDPVFREQLNRAKKLDEVSGQPFDCVYLAGGHGAMYDFTGNTVLQGIIAKQYESKKTVAAICHGVCGLLNVTLPGGAYLVKGKKLTGFSWFEEILAGRTKEVPFDLETALKERGARYEKAWIPLIPKVVVDGCLITGQDPFSSKKTATTVLQQLTKQTL